MAEAHTVDHPQFPELKSCLVGQDRLGDSRIVFPVNEFPDRGDLNTFAPHGVFERAGTTAATAAKLRDRGRLPGSGHCPAR